MTQNKLYYSDADCWLRDYWDISLSRMGFYIICLLKEQCILRCCAGTVKMIYKIFFEFTSLFCSLAVFCRSLPTQNKF